MLPSAPFYWTPVVACRIDGNLKGLRDKPNGRTHKEKR
jgi:hypothetical protein